MTLQLAAQTAPEPGQRKPKTARTERGREFLGLGPPADQTAAAQGERLFAQNCSFCHGANATGGEGPDLVRSSIVLHDEKGELIGDVVLKGRRDRGMPSFSTMTPEQIYQIAEFLHARVEAAANRFGYKILNVVTGNAKAGQEFFNGPGQCGKCHSVTGDLAHIGSKYAPADLQAQLLYPTASSTSNPTETKAPAQPTVSVTLASGESISGKLKRMDDFDVSLWDASGGYHSWPRDSVKVDINDPLEQHRELLARYTDPYMHNVLAYLVTLK
ncbi:MAG: c-type cytochrome [Acidobacteriaceae bacterium]|nr:c-type cytochrome [Acidobacteriaceae bacterium]